MKDVAVAVAQEEMSNAAKQVRVNTEPAIVIPNLGTVCVKFHYKQKLISL